MERPILRDYQERAVKEVRAVISSGLKRVVMVLPTGAGKSIIFAEIIRLAREKGNSILWLVHRRNLVTQMQETLHKFGIEAGIIMSGIESNTYETVQLGTIQTYSRRLQLDDIERNRFFINADVVLIDECFSGDTKILTISGEKRIDEVRCGDVVYNQLGTGKVEFVFSKKQPDYLLQLELENGEFIKCTEDHPFFTEYGWKKAKELEIGTNLFSVEGMRVLWNNVPTITNKVGKLMGKTRMLLDILFKENAQPYEQEPGPVEDERNPEENKTQTYKKGRERAIAAFAAIGTSARIGRGVESRVCCGNENTKGKGWFSTLLQNRHSQRRENDCDRDRWPLSHDSREENEGQEKDRISCFPRVVGITHIKREGDGAVYNLRVGGHPSYFANGVAVHNCHRSISKTYMDTIKLYHDKIIIACTATPMRADQRGLGEVYEGIVDVVGVKELTEKGHLSPARYFVPAEIDLEKIKITRGDYEVKELDNRINQPKLVGDIVENWLKIAEGRKTIIFCITVKHSRNVSAAFSAKGIPAYHLDAKSSDSEREDAFLAMSQGKIKIITNVALYQEGMDCPDIACVVMARPTKSLGLYRQCVGRGLRISGEHQDCIVIDHGGVVEEHGLVDDEVVWTLDGKKRAWKKKKQKEPKEKSLVTCSVCNLVFEGADKCPDCGSPVKSFGKKVETVDAELKELSGKKATTADKRRYLGMLKKWVFDNKKNPKMIKAKYRSKFGCWPHHTIADCLPIQPDQAFLNLMKHDMIKYAKGEKNGLRGNKGAGNREVAGNIPGVGNQSQG